MAVERKMGHRRKRQRLSENGQEASSHGVQDEQLSHSKAQRRSLFVRSLAPNTSTEDLTEHFSQSYPIKHAIAVLDPMTKHCKGYGFVTFADAEDAQRALEEFNGTRLHGKQLRLEVAEPRHRDEDEAHEGKSNATKPKGRSIKELRPSSKLIVRNLPWSINTTEKLTEVFRSYGKIKHAVVPKNAAGRMSGFGVILLRGRKNAEKALEGVNGKEVDGRTLAVDWAVDKETWQKVRENETRSDADAKEVETLATARVAEDIHELDEESSAASRSGEEDEVADGLSDTQEEVDSGEEDDIDGNSLDKASPPHRTSNDSTVFVRNIPFTCTDEDLFEQFNQFGPVRYARVVVDQSTDRSKGTGFVCFSKPADAEGCVREAPKTTTQNSARKTSGKKAENRTKSVLQDELMDSSGRYTLHGRVLQVTRAVDKPEADRLTKEGQTRRNARDKDKRRLYLLSEGTIPSNSPLYKQLSTSEIAMREASAKQRRTLIESNPALHISLTRLAVRNIPRTISSKDLKALARKAVVGFAEDVKAGFRKPLSKEELSRGREEMEIAEKERKLKGKGIVKQTKIVFEGRQGEKVAESGGAGRSRGYGFIEYYTHRSALMGMRWLNGHAIDYNAVESRKGNKVDKSERKRRLIVEFALENANVVHRRKDRELKARRKGELLEGSADDAADGKEDGTGRGSLVAQDSGRRGRKEADSSRDLAAARAKNAEPTKSARREKVIAKKRTKRRAKMPLASHR